jgi:AbrB family looped-hinge helix DNA binding protein
MSNIVSITSQGQISIPASIRRKLGLDKLQKAFVTEEKGKVIVEPITNVMDLAGSLKEFAFKNKTAEQIAQIEKNGVKDAIKERLSNKRKREGQSLLVIKP